jgi:prevent-host-death family protein
METMAVSRFKATCLAVLQRVKKTGRPIRITRFGKPVADVVPPRPEMADGDWLGCLAGRGDTTGDIVAPALDAEEWQALRR